MTLYVVRHGHAPNGRLSTRGREQAQRVADLLGGAGIERIVSSHYPRCLHTIEPLGAALALDVETHDALAEDADVDDTWAYLNDLAGTVAVCSHGNLLGPVLERAVDGGALVESSWQTVETGSVWRVELSR